MFIVKIQRPIVRLPDTLLEALVYDESRTYHQQLALTPERRREWFPHEELKVYRYAELAEDGGLEILGAAPEQPW